MSIGWAIVSTGRHPEQKMAPAINAASNTFLAAVVSRDLTRAQDFANRHHGLMSYDNFESMLSDPQVQVVYLASPNSLHPAQAIRAAQAGKHILCEKPMAIDPEDCKRMIDACDHHQVRLGIGFHLRYHPGHGKLRDAVLSGALGQLALAQAQWGTGARGLASPNPRPPLQAWWEDPTMVGAGAFMGTGVHCVDLLRFVINDEVVEVTAMTDVSGPTQPLEHLATVLLRFRNGTLGMITSSRRLPDSQNDISIYGSKGWGICEGSLHVNQGGRLRVDSETTQTQSVYEPSDPLSMYIKQVESFNECIINGSNPLASGWDGLKAAQVTAAMVESAVNGRAMVLEH